MLPFLRVFRFYRQIAQDLPQVAFDLRRRTCETTGFEQGKTSMRHTFLIVMAAFGLNGSAVWANQEAALVQAWYQQYLHRDADPGGFHAWVSVLRFQGPVAVQTGILGSEEYYIAHGYSPEGFVAGLYADILGRAAGPEEIQGWVFNLIRCGSRAHLAQSFLRAAQAELAQRALTAPPVDYPPTPAYAPPAPPTFNGGYTRIPYQRPSAYRAYR